MFQQSLQWAIKVQKTKKNCGLPHVHPTTRAHGEDAAWNIKSSTENWPRISRPVALKLKPYPQHRAGSGGPAEDRSMVWDWVSRGLLRSRCQGRMRHARNLSGGTSERENGEGARGGRERRDAGLTSSEGEKDGRSGGSVLDHSAVLKKVHQGTWSPRAEVTIRGVLCLPGMATLRIPGTLSRWLKVPLRNTARAITGTNILAQKLGPWVKHTPCGQRCERCIHMATTETNSLFPKVLVEGPGRMQTEQCLHDICFVNFQHWEICL